ncbi:hypothetical protein CR513_27525, partial [Mucuna pruriens]
MKSARIDNLRIENQLTKVDEIPAKFKRHDSRSKNAGRTTSQHYESAAVDGFGNLPFQRIANPQGDVSVVSL